jgi:hypothetical protein
MPSKVRALITVEDVDGSFRKFMRQAPAIVRQEMAPAINATARGVHQLMQGRAPEGPEAPHIKEDIQTLEASPANKRAKNTTAQTGYFHGSSDHSDQPHIALYNEFRPNKQPFMRSSADDMTQEFLRHVSAALQRLDSRLSKG